MRIHLHIGVEKTGTTAIQAYCQRNARRLREDSVLYPPALGPGNHAHLAIATADFRVTQDLRLRSGVRTEAELADFRARTLGMLREQVQRAQPAVLLLSSEHLSSRLLDAGVARLRDALAELSDDVHVVVYLRRQDSLLVSLYSTFVKSGSGGDIEHLAGMTDWLNYDALLRRWAPCFDKIDVRIYPPRAGTLIDDFRAAVGLPVLPLDPTAKAANMALDHRNTHLLAELNARLPAFRAGGVNPDREGLVAFLESRSSGPPLWLPPEERRAFLARFERSNEAVRATYFPNQATLFDADPVDPDPPPQVMLSDAVDLAAEMWTDRARLAARLAELERATLRARGARTARSVGRLWRRLVR